jgi:peptidoglycan/xylan/chitin deacetylase (PgdA/CDA1 family)
MSGSLLVLMYHGLHQGPRDRGRFDLRYSVHPDAFERQMQCLRARLGHTWLPGDRHAEGNQVMISFDDGDVSNVEVALPVLERLGLRAMFFITSSFVGQPGMLARQQVRRLAEAGMGVGSHGLSHRFLNTLDAATLREELCFSRAELESIAGRRVETLALPGGRGGRRELAAARAAGYRLVFGSEPGRNRRLSAHALVQRVPITRDVTSDDFDEILAWQGSTVWRMRWRHRLLALPKQLLGDERYDRLRQVLVG